MQKVFLMSAVPQLQPLSKEQCVSGLRTALRILDKWDASSEQACRILRISRST